MKELNFKKLKFGVTVLKTDYVGYKKLSGAIAQLVFLKGTRIMKSKRSQYGRSRYKLRADQAIVMMIVPRGTSFYRQHYSVRYMDLSEKSYGSLIFYSRGTRYKLGEQVKPNGFNTNINEHCGKGIHFFCTLKEAENY